MLLEHPEEGGNMLTKASVDVLWELDAKIMELEVKRLASGLARLYRLLLNLLFAQNRSREGGKKMVVAADKIKTRDLQAFKWLAFGFLVDCKPPPPPPK